jgi:enoyl-CoA hydratase/carnithine racemase
VRKAFAAVATVAPHPTDIDRAPPMEFVHAEYTDGILILKLNRADKKNALTQNMYLRLALVLEDANRDDQIRAVLLQGSSAVFTSGNDIADFADDGRGAEKRASERFMRAVMQLEKPLVAAVCGYAVGIGATTLLHCDYVVASEDVRIRFPFVDLGLCPEFASTLLLPLVVGRAKANEWMLLGATIQADEALATGLVNQVLPNDQVLDDAGGVARALAKKPAEALKQTRRLLKSAQRDIMAARVDEEREIFRTLRDTPDAQRIFPGFLSRRR